ncbi:hypothetical protein pb186bvf_018542 [Paramecium bursaria]
MQYRWVKSRPVKGLAFPTSREGASLIYVKRYNWIVLFGGISNGRLNDVMIFDINKEEWKVQQTQGRQPSPRCYHTGFYDEISNNLFFYGGQGDKGRSMTDFYVLNMQTFIWKRLFILEVPPNRHNHTLTDYQSQEKIIFGGACLPEDILYNDVWIFNYSAIQYTTSPEIPGAICTKRNTKGETPPPRQGHGACVFQNSLFVFGGKSVEEQFTIFKLSLENNVWKKILALGKAPTARAYFTTAFINGDVIIFGGCDNQNKILNETHILNLDDYHWSSPFTAGNIPTPRLQHSCCIIEEEKILIMGGLNQTYCSMDMFYLSEQPQIQGEWEQIKQPTALEQKASEAASEMIMEAKMDLLRLEEAIIKERQQETELKKEVEYLEQQYAKFDDEAQQQIQKVQVEHKQSIQEKKNKELTIETIFLMIKQEQELTKILKNKAKTIEDSFYDSKNLMGELDQFYFSIRKINGSDPREIKLKKLAESFSNDVLKAKEARVESLTQLTGIYKAYEILSKRNELELQSNRQNVSEMDNEYDQLIFETEHD